MLPSMLARRPILAALASLPVAAAARADVGKPKLGDSGLYEQPWFLNSFLDLGEDLAEAQGKGKGLLVLVEQRGCIYCKQFHEVHLAIPELRQRLQASFAVLQLDLYGPRPVKDFDGAERSEKALAADLAVRFTPSFLFFPRDAKPAGRPARAVEHVRQNGLLKPFPTYAMIKYAATGAFRTERDFAAYLKAEHAADIAAGGRAHTW
jgi:thioredoxin-related protein